MIEKYFGGYCEDAEHHIYSNGCIKKLRKSKKSKRKQSKQSRRANR